MAMCQRARGRSLNWGIGIGGDGGIVDANHDGLIGEEMTPRATAAGNGVSMDSVTANDAIGSHREIGKVVAALFTTGQNRIRQAGRGRGWESRRDAVGSAAAVAEFKQCGCEPGSVAGLVGGLRGVHG